MNGPILVTGATGGIGRATVRRLAKAGREIYASDRRTPGPDDLPPEVIFVPAELPADAGVLVDALPDTLHALVLVAGIIRTLPVTAMRESDFDAVFRTNVFVPLNLVSLLADRVAEGGSIVFVGSVAGLRASPNNLLYAASKAALHNAAKSLALGLAPRGIRVNVVAPGLIDTGLTHDTNEDLARLRQKNAADVARERVAAVPIGRIGVPEDVAAVVEFLLSSGASFVTGAEFLTTGGGHL